MLYHRGSVLPSSEGKVVQVWLLLVALLDASQAAENPSNLLISSTEEMKARSLLQAYDSNAQVGALSGSGSGSGTQKGEHTRFWKSSLQEMGQWSVCSGSSSNDILSISEEKCPATHWLDVYTCIFVYRYLYFSLYNKDVWFFLLLAADIWSIWSILCTAIFRVMLVVYA